MTRGTWRGLNQVCAQIFLFWPRVIQDSLLLLDDFAIPFGTLVAGSNTIQINTISGSSEDAFLSPNFVYDSVELF